MPALPKLKENLPPVRLPREDIVVLRRLAREEHGSNMSELIRALIRDHLARRFGANP